MIKTIDHIQCNKKIVLVRVDFNVPLNSDQEVTDETRIKAALPTIKKILSDGGSVVLMSHLGRPKNGPENKFSLRHILPNLSQLLGQEVAFAEDCIGDVVKEKVKSLGSGEVLLLENLRFYKEETSGDSSFAQQLASLGDIYINDAFGTAHRAHASTSIIAQFFKEKGAGYLMKKEIESANQVLEHGQSPLVAIMGGAKISDKILLVEQMLDKVDTLIIGGGMAYTFIKAKGGSIGKSLVENDRLDLAQQLLSLAKDKGVNLLLPVDAVIADAFSADANTQMVDSDKIDEEWMGLDIGKKSVEIFSKAILQAKTILWNGPMGVFEMAPFAVGTNAIAKAVASATQQGAFSLVGGGDSVAAINNLGYESQVSHVSTGGGALLEYMEGKVLPGIFALDQ